MNWFLVVVAIIVTLITLVIAYRLLHTFLDPEELKAQTETSDCMSTQSIVLWALKLIAVFALSLAAWISLLLPYDVANRKDPTVRDAKGGGLDVALMWQMTLWCVVAMTVVILPFGFFVYEAWDPHGDKVHVERDIRQEAEEGQGVVLMRQCCDGSCLTLMSIFVFVGLLLILYFGAGGKTEMSFTAYRCEGQDVVITPCVATALNEPCPTDVPLADLKPMQDACTSSDEILKIQVSFFVYAVGLLTAIGWVLFVAFAGVGLFYLPVETYYSWFDNKLESFNKQRVAEQRAEVRKSADVILRVLGEMEHRLKVDRREVNQAKLTRFTELSDRLDRMHRRNESYVSEGVWSWMSSPFIIYGRLLLFLFCTVWSLLWFLHMIVYTATRTHPMLNDAFTKLDDAFSLLGIMFYGSFSFYLLWATVCGCTKIGLMILCVRIHPMKAGETLLSSFLFNCILILYAAVACVSYCAMSFREYAANTVVDTLYGSYVNKLEGLRYIMEYFQYGLFAVAGLAGLHWLCCAKRRSFSEALQENEALASDLHRAAK
eukprot:TRINITY_DN9849_c0_g1_i1.p1 TRINITY_DN9849_c0_g1~~TRINITY_DN9849_c0_g1_i1.p1  ORF type:complete len:545 (+),score=198.98 TRINITY_DN9849_c0_g1_i1:73-1707(+)